MEKGINSIKLDEENSNFEEYHSLFRCSECRGTFQKPILATISSRSNVQTYYACPRCLSKVSMVKQKKFEETRETSVSVDDVKKVVWASHEDNAKCKHSLGYLKTRSKDVPIPDECLTCEKMIECLTR